MKYIIFTIIFMFFEVLKLLMMNKYWKINLERQKYPIMIFFENIYMIYLLVLLFTPYWYVGLIMMLISFVSAIKLMNGVLNKLELTKEIRIYLFGDGISSILVLSIIILKETTLWQ